MEIGTEAEQFLFWENLCPIIGIVSLQCMSDGVLCINVQVYFLFFLCHSVCSNVCGSVLLEAILSVTLSFCFLYTATKIPFMYSQKRKWAASVSIFTFFLNQCLRVCFAGGHSVCHSARMSHICLLSAVCVSVMLSVVCVCHAVRYSVCQFSISVKMSAYLSLCLFIWLSSCLSLSITLNARLLYIRLYFCLPLCLFARLQYIPICLSVSVESSLSVVCHTVWRCIFVCYL